MKNYNLAITILLTSFCLTACDSKTTNKTGGVESPAPIQKEKLELKKRLAAPDKATESKTSITPAPRPPQSQQIVRPVNRPQPSAWQSRPQATPQAIDWRFDPQSTPQPSAGQFNPQGARQARIDAAVANGRKLNEERQAQDAAAVGAGAARGLDRATDIFTPPQTRVRR